MIEVAVAMTGPHENKDACVFLTIWNQYGMQSSELPSSSH